MEILFTNSPSVIVHITEKRKTPKALWKRSQLLNFKVITLHSLRFNRGSPEHSMSELLDVRQTSQPNSKKLSKMPGSGRILPSIAKDRSIFEDNLRLSVLSPKC